MDAFSRRCICWSLSVSLETDIAKRSLEMALSNRKISQCNLIHHSDRGSQYSSFSYKELLTTHNIKISNSRKGNPYDNAICERFMGLLKSEEVNNRVYTSGSDVYNSIKYYIEDFYNTVRLHSSLNYLSPIEFEENLTKESCDVNLLSITSLESLNKS